MGRALATFALLLIGTIIILVSRKIWKKITGLEKKPSVLQNSETKMSELVLVSHDVRFKGFTLSRSGKGRLFFTDKRRIVFTNPNGKKVGFQVPFDKVKNIKVEESAFLKIPSLVIYYVDEAGTSKRVSFRIPRKFETFVDVIQLSEPGEYLDSWIREFSDYRRT